MNLILVFLDFSASSFLGNVNVQDYDGYFPCLLRLKYYLVISRVKKLLFISLFVFLLFLSLFDQLISGYLSAGTEARGKNAVEPVGLFERNFIFCLASRYKCLGLQLLIDLFTQHSSKHNYITFTF